MVPKIFFSLFLMVALTNTLQADQVTIQADLSVIDECPDYSTWNMRTLITELKKLKNDVFLYCAGQVPCALLTLLSAAGVLLCTTNVLNKKWHPSASLGILACAAATPTFAALYLCLENKKILARYNIDEINEHLAQNPDASLIV